MNAAQVILCIILPPAAVVDKGIKPILLVSLLTLLGWVPGVVCAMVYRSEPA